MKSVHIDYVLYKLVLYIHFISTISICFIPVGTRGLKSRMCPPYPHACRKRRLKWGAVI